jgi:hypothetical protein
MTEAEQNRIIVESIQKKQGLDQELAFLEEKIRRIGDRYHSLGLLLIDSASEKEPDIQKIISDANQEGVPLVEVLRKRASLRDEIEACKTSLRAFGITGV